MMATRCTSLGICTTDSLQGSSPSAARGRVAVDPGRGPRTTDYSFGSPAGAAPPAGRLRGGGVLSGSGVPLTSTLGAAVKGGLTSSALAAGGVGPSSALAVAGLLASSARAPVGGNTARDPGP